MCPVVETADKFTFDYIMIVTIIVFERALLALNLLKE